MALDLRRKPVVVAPSTVPAPAVDVSPAVFRPNTLPLAPGTKIAVTPDEERILESLGWEKGQPIPNVAAYIEQIKNERPDIPEGRTLQTPPEVQLEDLSPSEQTRLRQFMAQGAEQLERLQKAQQSQVETPSSPDVNRALDAIHNATAPQLDLTEAPVAMATAAAVPTICEQCGHRHGDDVLEMTDDDKRQFQAHLVLGTRFRKEYSLLNGQLKLVFRSLRQEESELSLRQVSYDDRDQLIPTEYEYVRYKHNYDLVLSLESITRGDKMHVFDEPLTVDWDRPQHPALPQTVLNVLYPYVMQHHINQDSLVRLCHLTYRRFQGLQRRLEANTLNADFWIGIVLPS